MYNINWVLKHLTSGAPNYAQSEFLFLVSWTPSQILMLKWGLTIFWTLYFFFFTRISIKSVFKQRIIFLRIINLSYLGMVSISGAIYVIGLTFFEIKDIYAAVRTLMGVAQSFIPLMIFYLLFKFMLNENDYPKKE